MCVSLCVAWGVMSLGITHVHRSRETVRSVLSFSPSTTWSLGIERRFSGSVVSKQLYLLTNGTISTTNISTQPDPALLSSRPSLMSLQIFSSLCAPPSHRSTSAFQWWIYVSPVSSTSSPLFPTSIVPGYFQLLGLTCLQTLFCPNLLCLYQTWN